MKMEDNYVHDTYNNISAEFDRSRYSPWPSVKDFVNSLDPNSYLLDAGCGNGKNMQIRDDLKCIGCDASNSFVDICKSKGLSVINANIKQLPFLDNIFDAVICIAVIHHIFEEKHRIVAINELVRVLKPKGKLLFQVWTREQQLTKKFIPIENSDNDFFVTWKGDNKRYYHLFPEDEIINLIKNINGIKLLKKEYEKDNWVIILEKNGNNIN